MANLLGEILKERGIVEQHALERALMRQKAAGGRIGTVLLEDGEASVEDIAAALAQQKGLPAASHDDLSQAVAETLALLPDEICGEYGMIPFGRDEFTLRLAMRDPDNQQAILTASEKTQLCIARHVCPEVRMQYFLNTLYDLPCSPRLEQVTEQMLSGELVGARGNVSGIVEAADRVADEDDVEDLTDQIDLLADPGDTPDGSAAAEVDDSALLSFAPPSEDDADDIPDTALMHVQTDAGAIPIAVPTNPGIPIAQPAAPTDTEPEPVVPPPTTAGMAPDSSAEGTAEDFDVEIDDPAVPLQREDQHNDHPHAPIEDSFDADPPLPDLPPLPAGPTASATEAAKAPGATRADAAASNASAASVPSQGDWCGFGEQQPPSEGQQPQAHVSTFNWQPAGPDGHQDPSAADPSDWVSFGPTETVAATASPAPPMTTHTPTPAVKGPVPIAAASPVKPVELSPALIESDAVDTVIQQLMATTTRPLFIQVATQPAIAGTTLTLLFESGEACAVAIGAKTPAGTPDLSGLQVPIGIPSFISKALQARYAQRVSAANDPAVALIATFLNHPAPTEVLVLPFEDPQHKPLLLAAFSRPDRGFACNALATISDLAWPLKAACAQSTT